MVFVAEAHDNSVCAFLVLTLREGTHWLATVTAKHRAYYVMIYHTKSKRPAPFRSQNKMYLKETHAEALASIGGNVVCE